MDTLNQAPPLEPYNLFTSDPMLGDALAREGGKDDWDLVTAFGERIGSEEVFAWGFEANRHPPELITHDRFGNRVDEVAYHPSYHALMDLSVSEGLHCMRYERQPGDGAFVTRNAMTYLISQVEAGHGCPISMTSASMASLAAQPELAAVWAPRVVSRSYDPRLIPADQKAGCLIGMGMTEKQGGSDVRANTSTAVPVGLGGPAEEYLLTGHKWFTSAPMCDAFLILAQAPGGLTCFLVPRVLPDGSRNPLLIQRLKDKLGNRANASAEIEYDGVSGWMVGEEGRGVATIIEMVNATRLDCTLSSAGLMRQAVAQAGWHVEHRSAFGAKLANKPLMQNVIADLEIETEAATLAAFRLAGAHERSPIDSREESFARIATPIAKYWVTKRCTPVVREALECIGGNGYVEESILPRIFRESPLNSLWEGAGNVIALDVRRAAAKSPASLDAFLDELGEARGESTALDGALDRLQADLPLMLESEVGARRLVEQMAVCWSASLLAKHGDPDVADAYFASRLGGDWGSEFGTLPPNDALGTIARRAVPAKDH